MKEPLNRDEEVVTFQDVLAERKLIKAMLMQALNDISREDEGDKAKKHAEAAKNWIMSNRKDAFSFLWCVENGFVNIDAELIVKRIRSVIIKGDYCHVWYRLFRRSSFPESGD